MNEENFANESPAIDLVNLLRELNDLLTSQQREIAETSLLMMRETIELSKLALTIAKGEVDDSGANAVGTEEALGALETKTKALSEAVSSVVSSESVFTINVQGGVRLDPAIQDAVSNTITAMNQANVIALAALTMGISTLHSLVTAATGKATQDFLTHKEIFERLSGKPGGQPSGTSS